MKLKTVYICTNCSYQSPKWLGKCPECESWSGFEEDVINISTKKNLSVTPRNIETKTLSDFKEEKVRIKSDIGEFDRVMGGGIIPGSLTLLSGEPGIGKSTLTLQIANSIAKEHKVLLISGEESVEQISSRARRLSLNEKGLFANNQYNLENILSSLDQEKPKVAIIDSIQVISSEEIPSNGGTISQIRYCTEKLLEFSKNNDTAIILIGHVTKEGNLAGPKLLEHLVDTVIHLEGDRFQQFRLLKSAKNRFGSCAEVGIFDMTDKGMIEVEDPSQEFLEGRKKNAIGSAITVTMEGTRPFLVEVQALVSTSPFGYPKRTANGFDLNRLQILIAVLEKYGRLKLQNQDVFINVVGGIKLHEPAADFAVLLAIASSLLKVPLPENSVCFGEVGLSGELRKVTQNEKRVKESKKLKLSPDFTPDKFKEIIEALKIFK